MTSLSAPAETIDGRFRARAAASPDHPAVLDDAGALTYGCLDAAVDRLAAALQRRGLTPGQTVALLLGNGRDFLVGYFAAVRVGAVPVPCHPQLAGEELQALLAHAEVSVIVAEAACRPAVDSIRAELSARLFVSAAADDATLRDADDRARPTAGRPGQPPDVSSSPWEPLAGLLAEAGQPKRLAADPAGVAALHYTSGTTGRPKGVLLSHRAVLATADVKARAYQLRAGSIVFCAPPLHHAAAMNSAVHEALLSAGGAVALTRRLDPSSVADVLAARRVTFTWMVPTLYLWILDLPDFAVRDFSALETCLFAAMPMPRAGILRLREALPGVRLLQNYGQTENAPMCTCIDGDEMLARPGSVGRPLPGNEVRILDPAGRDCPPGTPGDVLHRGPSVMLGYFKDPAATAGVFQDGWLRTGDTGYLDADGYLYLLGRTNEVINRGGVKISPPEVEETLLRHSAVQEAAVLGLPDPYYGQTVAAVVALRPGQAVTPAALQAHCRALLAHYKVPGRVAIVPALPRNVMGKVQKHLLLQEDSLRQAAAGE
jgi:acyl-CoA synthetase (AMP-forming)/AMP-acid ligase II